MPNKEDNIKTVYQEVCNSFHSIDDFRAKLLGFLPLASGTSIFLLLEPGLFTEKGEIISIYLLPIGIFGFVITLGLFFYELRGIQRCNGLIEVGKRLEKLMGVKGQFSFHPRKAGGFIGSTLAAQIIYPIVLSAWTYLAFSNNFILAAFASLFIFQGFFLGALIINLKVDLNKLDK